MSDGANIRVVRQKLHMNTTELGNHLGVSDKTVRNWEFGTQKIPESAFYEAAKLVGYYETCWCTLTDICAQNPQTIQIYKGYMRGGHTDQCPPNTWVGIVAEAVCNLPEDRLMPMFPEDGRADIAVMPASLAELADILENFS